MLEKYWDMGLTRFSDAKKNLSPSLYESPLILNARDVFRKKISASDY